MAQFEQGNPIGTETRFQAGAEQGEIARKGGRASVQSRREKKSLKNALKALLEMDHTNKQGEKKSGYEVIAIGLYNKAMKGDTKAVKLMAELVEEYKQKMEIGSNGSPFELRVVKTTEAMQDKINDYLNGSGLDGQGVQ